MSEENQEQKTSTAVAKWEKRASLVGDWIRNPVEKVIAETVQEKTIADFDKEDIKALVEIMGKWHFHLGITSEPDANVFVLITQFVYDHFGHLTLTDIRLAMEWVIAGKTQVAFTSYKSLSTAYISDCINKYEEKKAQIINDIARRKENHLNRMRVNEKIEATAQERADIHKDYLIGLYETYKEKGTVNDFGDFIYRWLRQGKIIDPVQADVNKALDHADNRIRKEKIDLNDQSIGRQLKKLPPVDYEQKRKKYAREYFIMKFFDENTISSMIEKIKVEYFQQQIDKQKT